MLLRFVTASSRSLGAARLLAGLTALALAWTILTLATGGFSTTIGQMRLSSRGLARPALTTAVLFLSYVAVAGVSGVRRDGASLRNLVTASRVALLLVLVSLAVALNANAWTAGGSDAYSYVTEADLLRRGDVRVPMPLAVDAPWPNALATLTPYGYRPTPDQRAIVPVTAPGLPLLMAALQTLAGHCAGFWIPPLAGALLLWVAFVVGRRLDGAWTGTGAAWLLATSPTFVAMTKSMMSDVPAAAFWGLALACVLKQTRLAVAGAGLSVAMAILIRPNLVPVAAVFGLWCAWRDLQEPGSRAWRTLTFGATSALGPVTVAAFNAWAYGSPMASGYGDLGPLFAASHVPVNLARYTTWLVATQTPFALAGLLALGVPMTWLWRRPSARSGLPLLGGTVAVVWLAYLAYTPFDAWWFLRFLLPAWLPMCVGMAVVIVRATERLPRWPVLAASVVFVALGARGIVETRALGVFPPGEGERRYASIALQVRDLTPATAIVITGQHAGAVRYYGGRLTLRFDQLDEAWLDRAVAWLAERQRPVYVLLEDWERPLFEQRFATSNRLGRLTLAPILAWRAPQIPGTIFLFDPAQPDGPTRQPAPVPDPRPRCVPPAAERLY